MRHHPTCATRSRLRDSASARSGNRSLRDLVQLDLVAERIEDIAAPPAGDGRRFLETRAVFAQATAHRCEIVHAQCEVASRVQTEILVGRKVHMSGWCGVPDPVAVRKRFRAMDLVQTEGFSVEIACLCLLARRVEDLRVVKGNGHEIECSEGTGSAIMWSDRTAKRGRTEWPLSNRTPARRSTSRSSR